MSNIQGILNNLVNGIESQTQNIDRKAQNTNGEWVGDAQKKFVESHNELKLSANKIKRELEDMKGLVRNLESSMQEADRDMARKAELERAAQKAKAQAKK